MARHEDISMRQLRYFAAAADAGQFSRAALKVHVSQSAITTAVLQLEELLGVKLFERLPHGVTLTAEGNRFYQHTRHVLDTLRDAAAETALQRQALQGVVRVGSTYAVLGYFLPNLLARFKRSYPEVEIDLRDMGRAAVEDGVIDGTLDFGLVLISNAQRLDAYERHVLIRSRRQLWMPSGHPLMQAPTVTLEEVAAHPYIMLTIDEGDTSSQRYWTPRGLEPKVVFRTSSVECLRGLVAHGFGVTILSDMLYRAWSLEGRKIEARPVNDAIPPMEVGLIWRRDGQLGEAGAVFRQFIVAACEK